MKHEELDWNAMWREARRNKSWQPKHRETWDKRADSFARRNMASPYIEQLLAMIRPDAAMTVLDVGAGPGTLALPLARRVQRVTAVDFSDRMLTLLNEQAAAEGLTNIRTVHGAWEDDWQALHIPPHDVCVASRSLSVDDLKAAILKLDKWATRAVFISDRVGAGPFDPELYGAIGRRFTPGPDYIYTVNLLYQLGIRASVNFITIDEARCYASEQEAIDACRWMFDQLSEEESRTLAEHVRRRLTRQADGSLLLTRRQPTRWAVLAWRKDGG